MMSRTATALVLSAVLVLGGAFAPVAHAGGEVTVGMGGVWPQGSFAAYGDPGPQFFGRVEVEIPDLPAAAIWLDVSFAIFSSETFRTEATADDIAFPVDQTTSQHALSFHTGLQLGSSSHNAFFRPRAAVGAGFYYFSTTVELRRADWYSDEEPLYSETLDSQFRFGWRGIVGADFFVSSSWGISCEFVYDHVFGLNRIEGEQEAEKTARFHGVTVGAVFSFD